MSSSKAAEGPEDAISTEEMTSMAVEIPESVSLASASKKETSPQKRTNAFAELMAPKRSKNTVSAEGASKSSHSSSHKPPNSTFFKDRSGLGAYIANPSSFPTTRVVSHDSSFVLIHDMYPKASIHLLLLPRDPEISSLHPVTALQENEVFRREVQERVADIEHTVAGELRRKFGGSSVSDRTYHQALEKRLAGDEPAEEAEKPLPEGRNWTQEVKAGIHLHPSMSHLHIHIISREMHSPSLKHRKHYNSFNTPFFIPVSEFPLPKDDKRLKAHGEGRRNYLQDDMVCWRCRKNFGNKFKQLKDHLEIEFEEWMKE